MGELLSPNEIRKILHKVVKNVELINNSNDWPFFINRIYVLNQNHKLVKAEFVDLFVDIMINYRFFDINKGFEENFMLKFKNWYEEKHPDRNCVRILRNTYLPEYEFISQLIHENDKAVVRFHPKYILEFCKKSKIIFKMSRTINFYNIVRKKVEEVDIQYVRLIVKNPSKYTKPLVRKAKVLNYVYEGRSFIEISELMGMKVYSVRNMMRRFMMCNNLNEFFMSEGGQLRGNTDISELMQEILDSPPMSGARENRWSSRAIARELKMRGITISPPTVCKIRKTLKIKY